MNGQPRCVIFYHSGQEWAPPAEQPRGLAAWNTGEHRRKYLRAPGAWQDPAGRLHTGEIEFWGEYETPTAFAALPPGPEPHLPRRVHTPVTPAPEQRPPGAQNSDPLTLGPVWIYSNCRQGGEGPPGSAGLTPAT